MRFANPFLHTPHSLASPSHRCVAARTTSHEMKKKRRTAKGHVGCVTKPFGFVTLYVSPLLKNAPSKGLLEIVYKTSPQQERFAGLKRRSACYNKQLRPSSGDENRLLFFSVDLTVEVFILSPHEPIREVKR